MPSLNLRVGAVYYRDRRLRGRAWRLVVDIGERSRELWIARVTPGIAVPAEKFISWIDLRHAADHYPMVSAVSAFRIWAQGLASPRAVLRCPREALNCVSATSWRVLHAEIDAAAYRYELRPNWLR